MTSCSQDARAVGEPLLGTAPLARSWIVIEQPGPWGHDAISDTRLPGDVAAHLTSGKAHGTTVLLARHPDRRVVNGSRHVWIAHCAPGHAELRHGHLERLEEVLEWDLSAIAQGDLPALDGAEDEPLHLVCTHSGRDLCCAVEGRALATRLIEASSPSTRVWECSHIGGHRFAPVTLSLPLGVVHGRLTLDEALALDALSRVGDVLPDRLRGRTSLFPEEQVAVGEVMRRYGIHDIDSLRTIRDGHLVRVRHGDGRTWTVDVEPAPLIRERLESCGKEPVSGQCLTCAAVEADY